jgi:OmpA-OmpF porin, OOP family
VSGTGLQQELALVLSIFRLNLHEPHSRQRAPIGLPVVFLLVLISIFAFSATAAGAEEGFTAQMFSPGLFGADTLSVDDAKTLPQLGFGFGLFYDYSPSRFTFFLDDEPEFDAIGPFNSLHFNAAMGFFDWWSFGVQVPFYFITYRDIPDPQEPENYGEMNESSSSIGDIRTEMKFRLLSQEVGWIGIAASPFVLFPTGDSDIYLGEGRVTGGGKLILGHDFDFLHVVLNGGYLARGQENDLFGVSVGDAIVYGAGISKTFDFGLGLGVEYSGRIYETEDRNRLHNAPMELMGTLQYRFGKKGPRLTAGGGPGLTNGIGTPPYRMVGGIDYFYAPSKASGIFVRTMDENGAPLPAVISIVGPEGEQAPVTSKGNLRIEIPPGSYTVSGESEGRDQATRQVEVRKGKIQQVSLLLPVPAAANTVLSIEMIDQCTKQDLDGRLVLEDGTSIEIVKGQYRSGVEPGTYQGTVASEGYVSQPVEVKLMKGETTAIELALVRPLKIEKSGKVNFAENTREILTESHAVLDDLAKQFKSFCDAKAIVIQGHTEAMRNPQEAMELSELRAHAVLEYLVEKGVERSKLKAAGYGATRPVASNAMAWGRDKNRRIDFAIEE